MIDNTSYQFSLPQNPNFREFFVCEGLLPHELDRIDALWDHEKSARAKVSGGDGAYVEDIRKSAVIPLMLEQEYRWILKESRPLLHR